MQILIIIIVSFLPCLLFAGEPAYVFIIDEKNNPVHGYKLLETQRNDIYATKVEPIKKWITNLRSELVVFHDGDLYPVKDSIIVDKRKGIALLLIDLVQRKSLYFNPEEILIDRDINLLIENKKLIFSEIKKLFMLEIKKEEIKKEKINYTALAEQYENSGQWIMAVSIYEDILKQQFDSNIINKIGVLHYRLGNFKKAREYFKMLLQDEQIIIKLVGISIIEKDFEGALRIINNSGLDSAYMHYLKGIVYYLMNKKDEAYKEVSVLFHMDSSLAQNLRDLLR